MAKLKSENIPYVTIEGEKANVSIGWEVSQDGAFTAIIPDWIVDIIKAEAPGLSRGDADGVSISFGTKNWRLSGMSKSKVAALIYRAMKSYSEPVITTEKVIRYTWDAEAAFVTDDAGTVAQNGYIYQKMTGKEAAPGGWAEGSRWAKMRSDLSATKTAHGGYNVRLAASVFEKTTTTRGASVKIEYKRMGDGHFSSDLSDPIYMLNSFISQGAIDHKGMKMGGWGSDAKPDSIIEEMPYTPEAAWFFVNALKGMCRMAKTMNDFFTDKEALARAIATGQGPLMIGGPR